MSPCLHHREASMRQAALLAAQPPPQRGPVMISASLLVQTAARPSSWSWLTSADITAEVSRTRPRAGRGDGEHLRFPRIAVHTPGGDLRTAGAAREFARSVTRRWRIAECCEDLPLVVSELLTNALRHTTPRPGGWPVRVGLFQASLRSSLLCAVCDPGPGLPMSPVPHELAESGRGLQVIEELSENWGCTAPGHSGKVVWASFATTVGPVPPQRAPVPPQRAAVPPQRAAVPPQRVSRDQPRLARRAATMTAATMTAATMTDELSPAPAGRP
jgi:anti-sigma regulatory factor (Ser/Thr protein kinase)